MLIIDLQDAHLHIPILPDFQHFFQFAVGSLHLQFPFLLFDLSTFHLMFKFVVNLPM